jgi:hypothetical protein
MSKNLDALMKLIIDGDIDIDVVTDEFVKKCSKTEKKRYVNFLLGMKQDVAARLSFIDIKIDEIRKTRPENIQKFLEDNPVIAKICNSNKE